jgi:hypothetical protein
MAGRLRPVVLLAWLAGASLLSRADTLTITTNPVQQGMQNRPFMLELGVAGGRYPYKWSITGSLPDGLTLDVDNGVISGTPTKAGVFGCGVSVIDALSQQYMKGFQFTILEELRITTLAPLPGAAVGQSYSLTFTATGGTLPYRWILMSAWPGVPGIELSESGVLTGKPVTAGTYSVTVQAQDKNQYLDNKTYSLRVASDPLSITTASLLPGGIRGQTYSTTLAGKGGFPPYAWSLSTGSLPAALSLSSAGVISGVPNVTGTFTFTVSLKDSALGEVKTTFTLSISDLLAITTACPLPDGTAGTAYSLTLAASGGTPAYAWSVSAGALPSGLALNASSGVISGTPAVAGTAGFTLRVTDAGKREAIKACQLAIALAITPASLPNGTLGKDYAQTLRATGGTGPYQWSLVSSDLPPGLSLFASTGEIRGIPTGAGTYTFTVRVRDSSTGTTGEKAFTLTIDLVPPVPTISGLPDPIVVSQQLMISLSLASSVPVEITGQLQVQFKSEAVNPCDDPMIGFASGGKTVTFRIPANATGAVFGTASAIGLQTGTTAGTLSLVATLNAGGKDVTPSPAPTRTARIGQLAPAISVDPTVERTSGGLLVRVIGYSTPRQVQEATFTFSPASGRSLQTSTFTVTTLDASNTWFRSASSTAQFGGQFTYEQPFTVSDPSAVNSVTVTLRNSAGSSQPRSKSF